MHIYVYIVLAAAFVLLCSTFAYVKDLNTCSTTEGHTLAQTN